MQGREHDQVIITSPRPGGFRASWAMKPKKQKQVLRNCAHCGQPFVVEPRVGKHHRFCAAPACRRASQAAAWEKYRKNNAEREGAVARVQVWRENNPRYWRRTKRAKGRKRPQFRLTEHWLAKIKFDALRDTIDTFFTLGSEMAVRLTPVALRDTMAKKLQRARLRGHEILRLIQEDSHH